LAAASRSPHSEAKCGAVCGRTADLVCLPV